MRLPLSEHERAVLLDRLRGTLAGIGDAYSAANRGAAWDEYDERNPHDLVILVRARDDLVGRPPWRLDGPRRDLELVVTRIRAGSSLALEIGGQPSPVPTVPTLNESDPAYVNEQLDTIAVCDSILSRLLA